LSGYLPLTGGTLTGALSGTSATFSDKVGIGATPYASTTAIIRAVSATSTNYALIIEDNATNQLFEIKNNGAATFSSSVQATAFIPSGATVPSNGMYLSAANTLNFATNTTNRLTIASTGAATFSGNLTCSGLISQLNQTELISSTGASNRAYAFGLNNAAAGDFTISQGSTATGGTYTVRLTINPTGNVGIGTASPVSKLTVFTPTTQSNAGVWSNCEIAMHNSTSVGDYSQIGLGYTTGTTNAAAFIGFISTSATANGKGSLVFGTRDVTTDTAPTERMSITSEGYLGTTVTSTAVFSGDLLGVLSFVSKDTSTYSSGGITNIRSYATTTYNTGGVSGDLRFYVSDNLQNTTGSYLFGTEAMRITSGGNVLIGSTTDGGQKLQVTGNMINTVGNNVLVHRVIGATTGYNYGYWTNTSGSLLYGIEGSTAAQLQTGSTAYDAVITTANATGLSIGVNQTQYLRIASTGAATFSSTITTTATGKFGAVNIRVTSPTYDLQLVDDSAAKPSTNTWTIASDSRVKENITPYTKGLSAIMAINPVNYDYNGKAGFSVIKGNIGLIAQDVLEILPESVSTYMTKLNEDDEEKTELYNFNSHALTYILINAIKEQQAQIEELKALIIK